MANANVKFEELVGNNPEQRNWRGMCIAFLVILLVCGCVVLAIVLLSKDNQEASIKTVPLSDVLDETWKEGLARKIQWVAGSLIWQDNFGNVLRMISRDIDPATLITNTTLRNLGITDFVVSGDFRYALLAYNKKQEGGYLYSASYYVYNIQEKTRRPLLHKNVGDVFQHAGFGPRGNQLLYAVNGNIYYQESVISLVRNLTDDDQGNFILKGISNWQYEEFVFKSSIAHWFSPNGQFLAYVQFDDTGVADAYVTSYSETLPSGEQPYVYPKIESYKYSKAGSPNTIVDVHVVDLISGKKVTLVKPFLRRKPLDILHALSWSHDSETILITWSNRPQSLCVTQQCSPYESACRDDILQLKAGAPKNHGWISQLNQPHLFSNERGVFFYIMSRPQGSRGAFNHIAMVNYTENPSVVRFLTDGFWEATKLVHYSPSSRSVYYLSNEQHPNTRHLHQVNIESLRRVCLSCTPYGDISNMLQQFPSVAERRGVESCLYYDVEFGTSSNWFLLHCLGPGIPYSATGSVVSDQDNRTRTLHSAVPPSKMAPSFLYNYFPLSMDYSDGMVYRYGSVTIKERIINFKMLQAKGDFLDHKPFVFQMGNIGLQKADFRFRLDFAEYFVARNKVAFIFVDGAGSGNRGNDILHSVFGQPGVLEVEEINAVVGYVAMHWKLKPSKVGIMGKGYGGYVSVLGLTEARNNIHCGIAVSPIVDWALHSSFESEKIVGNPLSDELNYEKSNLLKRVDLLKERKLLVFQGMRDKIVNQQHAILLQQNAMNKDLDLKTLQTVYYAKQNHGLTHRKSKEEMYKTSQAFLLSCLYENLPDPNVE